ncbi:MAG: hypothetical protein NC213_01990 [Acetobacter sp.]|nr:hypothetical protein [Bacteroides sp.]MCM1340490.1 hypothetical protein [Acetobacter sp.]MCM1433230.1 hypothetical protein [Clostridiales bacterium]
MSHKLVWIENHKEYLDLLNKLKFKTKYIYLYVGCPLNDEHHDFILEYCNDNLKLIEKRTADTLFGKDKASSEHLQYIFSIENYNDREQFFDFLSSFETFFHRECLLKQFESYQNRCDFGLDDIGFVDNNNECLCYTITHEAMTYVNDKL